MLAKLLFSVAVTAALVSSAVCYLIRDPSAWFSVRRTGSVTVHEGAAVVEGGSILQPIRLRAASGLEVELTLRRQVSDSGKRLPLALILGGHVRGREAAQLVGETPGLAVAAISYPFRGDVRPSGAQFLRQLPKIRGAFLDTPPALLIALDYLLGRPDVDQSRVEGIGVSLGAPFMTIAGALDPRFSRVWAIHGSGGAFAPLEASMKRTIASAPLRIVAASVASVIIAGPRLAPERWAQRISPRPFVMVNARDDERMPLASVRALYDAATSPKEIIWMDGRHIRGDAPTIRALVDIVLQRVRAGSS
jgi:hypothetical protein